MKGWRAGAWLPLVVLGLLACGGSDLKDNALESKGGTLQLTGGVILHVPEGALTENQAFEWQAVDAPTDQGFAPAGPFVSVQPTDLTFQVPVTLTLPFGDAVEGVIGVAWSDDGATWERREATIDPDSRALVLEVTRLGTAGAARWSGDTLCCAVSGRARALGEPECTARAGIALADAACACGGDPDCDDGDACTTEACSVDQACAYQAITALVCGDGCRLPGEACEADADCEGDLVRCVECACVAVECRSEADCEQPDTNCSRTICTEAGTCQAVEAGCHADTDCPEGQTCDGTCSCVPE